MPLLGDQLECFEGPQGEKYIIIANGNMNQSVDFPIYLESEVAAEYKFAKDLKKDISIKFMERNPQTKVENDPYKVLKVELGAGEGTLVQLIP